MRKLLTIISVGSLLLAGCTSNTDDLNEWVESVKAKPAGSITPAPEVKQTPKFEYSASDFRSPFAELEPEVESELQVIAEGCDASVQPDPNRTREDLERFSLDSMEMVGAMAKSDVKWGLIKMSSGPSQGKVFKVAIGNYLGVNHGKITDIDEFRIVIETLVPDGQGCWEKRVVNMALNE
ncbi:pilus assembly protein PilP [Pleionea litopenaei]|uniref:Pilus assembly protein PilP n=1 Tax=Pleionea litopenaei TaxID=3070815 RepID=A0AA51X6U9_9GAMM|nr:pilus assembly protein PilP [Pleionea sp. HL-JVS1]WMS86455.1 pilus assembly protein PilP [Pleionea sp. HL-JVS1]